MMGTVLTGKISCLLAGLVDIDNIEVRFHYLVASLSNQVLPEFSSIQFKTLHRYYKHIKGVYVTFCRQKRTFDKITAFLCPRDDSRGGIKICPCLSICLSVRLSVRSSRFMV